MVSNYERLNGFNIEYLSDASFRYAYEEIFTARDYAFSSDVERPLILDCGANIGLTTLFFKQLYPECTIAAFEPDPETFRALCRNIEANHLTSVQAHNVALWDRNGALPFFVSMEHPGFLQMSACRSRCDGPEICVPCAPLSDFITGPVDFVKMEQENSTS